MIRSFYQFESANEHVCILQHCQSSMQRTCSASRYIVCPKMGRRLRRKPLLSPGRCSCSSRCTATCGHSAACLMKAAFGKAKVMLAAQ